VRTGQISRHVRPDVDLNKEKQLGLRHLTPRGRRYQIAVYLWFLVFIVFVFLVPCFFPVKMN